MKHLHIFNTVADYEAVKDTLEMPYIVLIDETDSLQYNTDTIRISNNQILEVLNNPV